MSIDETKRKLLAAQDAHRSAGYSMSAAEWLENTAKSFLQAAKGMGINFDTPDGIERAARIELVAVDAVRRAHEITEAARDTLATSATHLEQYQRAHDEEIAKELPPPSVAQVLDASRDAEPVF